MPFCDPIREGEERAGKGMGRREQEWNGEEGEGNGMGRREQVMGWGGGSR